MTGKPSDLSTTTVFCDFDGPIVDVSTRYYSTYRLALAQIEIDFGIHNLSPLSYEAFWQLKRNRIPDLDIAARSGLCPEAIDPFLQAVSQIVNHTDLLYQDTIQPGVNWALNLLHSQGTQLVLVTLRGRDQAEEILQAAGLRHLFAGVIGTIGQPDAAFANSIDLKTKLLQQAADKYWPPAVRDHQEAWMIGDTEADIWAGRNLGIITIALTCGIRSREYLQQQAPNLILEDLLSASHHLMRQPQLSSPVQL
jgi:phosphoglycolate phosphatase